ncbi:MAG: sodium:solute symporter family protein [Phycisphaerales bacterium]|nr:MAG: sodium:solute symporter family protein [Phycisphaerales bacterium]
MLGLELIDWIVIIAYLLIITLVGLWAVRKVRSSASFFIGDRKFGKVMMAFFMFGSGTHSDQAVAVAAKTYRSGVSGIWYQWLWLFVTPFFWLIAPFFRRMRAVTTGDYFEVRYSRSVSGLYAVMGILQLLVAIGVMLKGSGVVVEAVSGGDISSETAIIAMTVIFLAYGIAGGLSAAIATNFIQGLLTVILSFLILPFALGEVGGMSGLRQAVEDPEMLSLVAPGEIGLFYIAIIAFNALIAWVTMPETMANCAAGRREIEGRIGVTVGIFGKRVCTVAWMLTGLCAVALYTGARLEEADFVYGRMARELLPEIAPGLIGLFIASLLASVMSTCDALMVVASGLFTENLYKKFLSSGKPDSHYKLVGRVASAIVVLAGIVFAFRLESVVSGLEIFWQVSAMMGIAFWVGLFWRRSTVAGAWAGTLVSFGILLLTMLAPIAWFVGRMPLAKQARFLFVREIPSSPLLQDWQLADVSSLAIELRDAPGPLAAHIRENLSEETKTLLSQYDSSAAIPKELPEKIIADLNLVVQGKLNRDAENAANATDEVVPLYEQSRFADMALSVEVRQLIAKNPEGRFLVELNRRLLEEAYPDQILKSWQFSTNHIKRPVKLALKLKGAKEEISLYIAQRLSDQAKTILDDPVSIDSGLLAQTLASELNRIAGGENIYDDTRFARVFTRKETVDAAREDLHGEKLAVLNSHLLEEAFIWEIAKSRGIEIYLPWAMIFYLIAGFVALVAVSLFTRRTPKERLDQFYDCIRTPVGPDEPETEPLTLPAGVQPGQRNVLIQHPDFEIPKPTLIGIGGFLAAWVGVGLLIGAVYWIIQW